jgi:hypothetical protein
MLPSPSVAKEEATPTHRITVPGAEGWASYGDALVERSSIRRMAAGGDHDQIEQPRHDEESLEALPCITTLNGRQC